MSKIAVVALGGNALLRGNQLGYIHEQEKNAYDTSLNLLGLINSGFDIVITHGNGPQVGNILLRNEAGYTVFKIPKMPLDICVADSQGGIGYMIERQLRNILKKNGINKNVVSIITQVLVDKNDPAFNFPSKPVGSFYLKEEAELLSKANNWTFKEDPRKRGWRRVVASPNPIDIINKDIIREMVLKGNIVIASGGGGIPVYLNEQEELIGIDAVIDKDSAASLLSREILADAFYILTDVPKVCINFNKPNQVEMDVIKVEDAKKYLEEGQFPAGSMGPKIQAAVSFIENGGTETIITDSAQLSNPNAGTKIIR